MLNSLSDGVLVAAIGAIFNAGVMWATLKFLTWRISRNENITTDNTQSLMRAHQRIDDIQRENFNRRAGK